MFVYYSLASCCSLLVCFICVCESAGEQTELEKLQALLYAERNRNHQMTEIISGLKQDKELLQQELTKKAELICDFMRPGRVCVSTVNGDKLGDYTSTARCDLTNYCYRESKLQCF